MGKIRIAKRAIKVAAGKSHKNGWPTAASAFALQAVEYLFYEQWLHLLTENRLPNI
ncbi:hypothetical protein PORCAN_1038 [Porphyromonas crevioricanis JCM 13913]|nr:hypothetical protein PORCAN_1038 [Porphyromonas crevioricanis JCM 13913]